MCEMRKVFNFIGIIVGTQFIVSLPAVANTTYVSGHITSDASWTKTGSPYIVEGDVYVDSLVTLTIEPGVEVRLDSMKCIEIYGTLNAIGTDNDSIIISALDTTKRWSTLWFKSASAAGSISYCRIEYADNSAICENSTSLLVIEYNTITNNSGFAGGICSSGSPTITGNTIEGNSGLVGGIYLSGSAIIRENTITGNSAVMVFDMGGDGGGIWSSGSPIISGNIIEENSACEGGGIYSDSGLPTITGNTIKGNSASYWNGGGIYSKNGSPIISGNIIEGNRAGNGGGIYSFGSPTITGNTIKGNSGYGGGGIYSYGSSIITGNTIIDNSVAHSGGSIRSDYGLPIIKYNTITDTTKSAIYIYSDSALIDSNNIYATGYTVYNNSESSVNACHNYWGTASSDTIDMKIWDFYDDDSSGIVYYEPFLTEPLEFGIEEASNYQLTISNYQLSIYPNPSRGKFVIRYSLNDKHNNLRLTIHDISGRLVESFELDKSSPYKNVIKWEPKNLVSGIYFVKLATKNFSEVQKVTILR